MARRARGSLEASVLQLLWGAPEPLTSADVRQGFSEADRPALTTVLTVLDRLEGKGFVVRTPARGGALFSATRSESEETATVMARALAQAGDRASALMQFAGQLDEDDLSALREVIGGDDA